MDNSVLSLLQLAKIAPPLLRVAEKVLSNERISAGDGNLLYQEGTLPVLSLLAEAVSQRFNKNLFHDRLG